VPRDLSLEQNFLVIQSNYQFYLVPMQNFYEVKDEDKSENKVEYKSEIVKLPYFSSEEKVEVAESVKKSEDRKLNLALKVYNKNLNYTCSYCWKNLKEIVI